VSHERVFRFPARYKSPNSACGIEQKRLEALSMKANKAGAAEPEQAAAPRRQTQAERRRKSETRILNAALKVIAKRGVTRMTLAEVGERAGYSRGLPAHLFGTKSNLLCRCAEAIIGEAWKPRLPEIGPEGGVHALITAIRDWLHLVETRVEYARAYYLIVQETYCSDSDEAWPELRAVVRELVTGAQSRFADYLEYAREHGEIRADIDPQDMASLIHATLRGFGLQWLVKPEAFDLRRFGEIFIRDLERRLKPAPK
jgi:AcrR family transcriptional regulator